MGRLETGYSSYNELLDADTETGSYEMVEMSVFVSMKEVSERKDAACYIVVLCIRHGRKRNIKSIFWI